ncbi:pilus assembly protein PilO [Allofranklinella schreckenbergeri]|uniref:Pilus assembly protein PilO n=1 Tax=Allofranklinella schreckenbergeri TaxID=1076744 RepID=A0A3M6QDU7_9BURK|nr:type 4a pilus biogenesis protein PilO [Allofranklinella schreckenbergeri]RMX00639.1 pilus assembly protein PilO [Allofranklinella schreckenbergeri]RMX00978.1 pilus assembly protein PilO [Allofranklinella schreckenbergeri]RRD44429.1 pilus assembly protein PilO [Comamonadaceae bacterium OH3737_COT-264]
MKDWASQFRQASGRDPWLWPILPRIALFIAIAIAVAVLAWFFYLTSFKEELEAAQAKEASLRSDFSRDYKKAINLEALKKQKEQAIQYVSLLEKQLPNKAEMDALLSDINQAGIGRGLHFELFKPGAFQIKDYYGEQPIDIVVTGNYDAIGEFASDIAHLSRIVTIGNMHVTKDSKDISNDRLTMKAVAKTYRYLSPDEQIEQAKEKNNKGGKK